MKSRSLIDGIPDANKEENIDEPVFESPKPMKKRINKAKVGSKPTPDELATGGHGSTEQLKEKMRNGFKDKKFQDMFIELEAKYQETINALNKKNGALNKKIGTLMGQKFKMNRIESDFKKKTIKFESEIKKLKKENETLKAGGSNTVIKGPIKKACNNSNNGNKKYGSEIKELKAKITIMEREKNNWNNTVTKYEEEINELKLKNETLETKLKMTDATKNILLPINENSTNAVASVPDEMRKEYNKKFKARVAAYNEIQNKKGNIRVFARVRPMLQKEINSNTNIISYEGFDKIHVEGSKQVYQYDGVFDHEASNDDVFKMISSYIRTILDGFSVTIFAYGQTGTGKTYTMNAFTQNALTELLSKQENESDWEYTTELSIIEIYNEKIIDLLVGSKAQKNYRIRSKIIGKGKQSRTSTYVDELKKVKINDIQLVQQLIAQSEQNRKFASTDMNDHSSRSHYLIMIEVFGRNKITGLKINSKLNLIDLAGSERITDNRKKMKQKQFKEMTKINRSLSVLGNVMRCLHVKQEHVPYRDSKLTYLLKDSMDNQSKMLMIMTIGPADRNRKETLQTLTFGQRAKKVDIGTPKKNFVSKL